MQVTPFKDALLGAILKVKLGSSLVKSLVKSDTGFIVNPLLSTMYLLNIHLQRHFFFFLLFRNYNFQFKKK